MSRLTYWESRIVAICEKMGIETDVYNEDPMAKDLVAKALGFSNYESFEQLPSANQIVNGIASPLLKGHYNLQYDLINQTINHIEADHALYDDIDRFLKQTKNFTEYVNNCFEYEYTIIANQLMETLKTSIEI